MSKILKVKDEIVSIGTDDGKIKEARLSDLNFDPEIGDEVEIFETENDIVVTKKVEKPVKNENMSGININLSNNQGNASQPVYVASNTKAVNKVTYCLLALFLGGLGVHKFYAGKTGAGIVCILFCWTFIPAFVAFIECIVALCKTADQNGNILV